MRSPDRTATNEDTIAESPGLDIRQVNRELHRNAIRSITDMLTLAKLIDDGRLLTTIFINQTFFHAACAYTRDMLRGQEKGNNTQSRNFSPFAFLIPSRAPTMDFQIDDVLTRHPIQQPSFLSLIAKGN